MTLLLSFLSGCGNDPYLPGESGRNVLFLSIDFDPKTLDPAVSITSDAQPIVDAIYASYLQYHYLKRDPVVLEPNLGAVEPKRAPDGKGGEIWTFTIRKGLRFQDDPCFPGGKGREIVGSDFLYAFRRIADPALSSPVLGFIENKIVGLKEHIETNRKRRESGQPTDYSLPIAGLIADPSDPYTFRIHLNKPYPQLRYLMAMHFTAPMAREAAERYGKDLARHPVGCGPYVLSEMTPKLRVVLDKNPNRREEFYPSEGAPGDREAGLLADAGKPLPLADRVVFNVMREDVTGWNLFLQGYQDTWGVSQQNYNQALGRTGSLSEEMTRRGITLERTTLLDISFFSFNMDDTVVGGTSERARKLRQAISVAMDPQAFIDLFSLGNGTIAQFILPPGIFGYEPNYRNPNRKRDIKRAKQLLADAGYPNGIDPKTGERLTIYYDNAAQDTTLRQYVRLVEKQLSDIGIKMEGRTWTPNVWMERIEQGKVQFVNINWYADYPDPEDFLLLLYSKNKRPGPNMSNYKNAAYDKLFEKMQSMDDGPERMALIRQMRAIVEHDCPWVNLNHNAAMILIQPWLRNVKVHPMAIDYAKYLRVDAPLRAQMIAKENQPNLWPGIAALLGLGLFALPAVKVVRDRTNRRVRVPDADHNAEENA